MRLSKTREAEGLTGVGGGADHGTWLGRWWDRVGRAGRLFPGLRLSFARFALLLQALQLVDGLDEGMLEARALLGEAIEQVQLGYKVQFFLREDALLSMGQAGEEPVRGYHLFHKVLFSAVDRMPVGHQIFPELVEFGGVFAREEEAAGAEAVFERVEFDGFLAFRGDGSGRFPRIAPVGFLLLFGNEHNDLISVSMIGRRVAGDGRRRVGWFDKWL